MQPPEVTEQKGDLIIRDLWQQGTDSVHDVCVVNTDALTHRKKYPEKCIHEAEWGEKKMYLEACIQHRRHFSPFVASGGGMLGVEATANLKRIASRLATKWKQSYSKTCRYVNSRIAITLVCAPPTAAYKDPGCQRTGSVCSSPSDRTARGSNFLGKHTSPPPNQPNPLDTSVPRKQQTIIIFFRVMSSPHVLR